MEERENKTTCPGCGVVLDKRDVPPGSRYNASAECWALYGELTAYTLSLGDPDFPHQLVVDAYAAQHASEKSKPIGTAFALIGLCLVCERDYTGKRVQLAHMALGRKSKMWPKFDPPDQIGSLTVAEVVSAKPGNEREAMIKEWACSVWKAWTKDHERVRRLIPADLRVSFRPR